MNKIEKILKRREEMLSTAEAERRDLNESEEIEWKGQEVMLAELRASDNLPKKTIAMPAGGEVSEVRAHGVVGGLADTRKLFSGPRFTAGDCGMKTEEYLRAAAEGRTMVVGSGVSGGFFAPESWSREILQTVNSQSVALPRCRIFPMTEANTLHLTLWDSENQAEGYFAGLTPDWKAEAGTFSAKTPKMRSVTLIPHKLGLYINLSRECIQDAGGIAAEVQNRMAYALAQTFDQKILNGNGVAEPLGVIQSSASVVYNRAVGNQISWADVVGMLGKLHPAFHTNAAWFANPSVMPFLLTLSDASSRAIWIPGGNAAAASPGLLYGKPVFLSDKVPALGSKGDLILADLSLYAVGMRQQISVERSDSPEWYADLVSLRSIMRATGCPLLDDPITPQNGTELSAFVVLQ